MLVYQRVYHLEIQSGHLPTAAQWMNFPVVTFNAISAADSSKSVWMSLQTSCWELPCKQITEASEWIGWSVNIANLRYPAEN